MRLRRSLGVLSLVLLLAAGLAPGGTFSDDNGNPHEPNIEALYAAGITTGCASGRFCPSEGVTRGQMAAFLARALELPPASNNHFTDDDGSPFEDFINQLAAAGITTGCTATTFCPNGPVTREQMAAFLVRAYAYADSANDRFVDDEASPFEDEINRLAAAGITTGCTGDRFCPQDPVSRDQMATFLVRAEGLTPIPVPPPGSCPILPGNNIWNTRVDGAPVHALSAQYVASIGANASMHADFGSGVWPPGSNSPIGIPFVDAGTTPIPIIYTAYGDESDPARSRFR